MDFIKSHLAQLKLAQLTLAACAFGIMANIFDTLQESRDKANFGSISAAFGITMISIAAQFFQLERKLRIWKILEAQILTAAGVVLFTGWVLFIVHVNEVEKPFREGYFTRDPIYKRWLAKACSALILEGLIIPVYFIIPYMPSENQPSKQESMYESQRTLPTTFYNNAAPQQPTANPYGYASNQSGPTQQQRLYNQPSSPPPTPGYYSTPHAPSYAGGYQKNQQLYLPNAHANPRPGQYY